MIQRQTAATRGRPTSPIRQAVRADLKQARRRLYQLIQQIDVLIRVGDDDELVSRAAPLVRGVMRLPDA
jgi:hypothetical protein